MIIELTYCLKAYRLKGKWFATRHHQPLLGDQIFPVWPPSLMLFDLKFDEVWTWSTWHSSKLLSWQAVVTIWWLRFCGFEFGKAGVLKKVRTLFYQKLRMVFVCSALGSNITFGQSNISRLELFYYISTTLAPTKLGWFPWRACFYRACLFVQKENRTNNTRLIIW